MTKNKNLSPVGQVLNNVQQHYTDVLLENPVAEAFNGTVVDYALKMVDLGCRVFPIRPKDKRPAVKNWQAEATLDKTKVSRFSLFANYGVKTGSGLVVLDTDGPEGEEALRVIESSHGPLPETLSVQTRNGNHRYFSYPPTCVLKNTAGKLGLKLDTRADGGYVVGPGSTHPTGGVYTVQNWGQVISPLPDSWVQLLSGSSNPDKDSRDDRIAFQPLVEACRKVSMTSVGQRNNTLNQQAYEMGRLVGSGELARQDVEAMLSQAAKQAGLDDNEIVATLRSGLDSGLKKPNRNTSHTTPTFITGKQLMETVYQEPRWAIPNLLPEGLSILAGPPKIGKSWLALQTAVSIACGNAALNNQVAVQGDVLCIFLEDNGRRIQARVRKQNATERLTQFGDNIQFAFAWPRMDEGGLTAISDWLASVPNPRLVIIDTLQRFRPRVKGNSNNYQEDYEALGTLQTLAVTNGIAVLVIHHLRKMAATDVFEQISGTQGIAGAADAILVLKRGRGQSDGILSVTGRDIQEGELALTFDADNARWDYQGAASEYALGQTRSKIIDLLKSNPAGLPPKTIAELLELNPSSVRKTLIRMQTDTQLVRDHGVYMYKED